MGHKYFAIVVTGLVAIVAPLAVSGSAATAATRSLETTRARSGRFTTAGAAFSMGGSAGYLGGTASPAKVKLKLTVPVIDCSAAAPDPLFVQVFLNGTAPGGAFSGSGMDISADCNGTTPEYNAQVVVDDANGPAVAVAPGDIVAFDGSAKARSESYTVTDTNTAQVASATGVGLSIQNLQLTVQGGFNGAPTFPPFTAPIKYSAIKVNAAVFSTLNPNGSEQVDASNRLEIRTSVLSGAGDAFSLKFVRNT
jgi:hypothetical protein